MHVTELEVLMSEQRGVAGVYDGDGVHWVGDGFRVSQMFPGTHDLGYQVRGFLLMDYHAPYDYEPTDSPRGVGVHPHRGFETVTIAFEGALAHHDSSGGGGVIRAGDVQWMTAASGILHKEYHEKEWAARGGTMHMMQLWVNLPADHKMDEPTYQPITADQMGRVELPDGAGSVTIIAGEYQGVRGPAHTFTPINLWQVQLEPGGSVDMAFPESENAAVFVLEGEATANGSTGGSGQLVLFGHDGTDVHVRSEEGAHLLVLNGEPIREPVMAHGPFVMNTRQQIIEAIDDFNAGKFGELV